MSAPMLSVVRTGDTVSACLDSVLADMLTTIRKYVWRPQEWEYTALVLWAAHTHFLDAFQWYPHLVLRSPAGGYGKSQTLLLLRALVQNGMYRELITRAAAVRLKHTNPDGILLLDQKETRDADWSRLIDIATRRGAVFTLTEGETTLGKSRHVAKDYSVGGPLALGYIRGSHDPLTDSNLSRAIILEYNEKAGSRITQQFPYDIEQVPSDVQALAQRLAELGEAGLEEVRTVDTGLPPTGRLNDTYRPLFAIAALAGDHWLRKARAVFENAPSDEAVSENLRVLRDLVELHDGKADDLIIPSEQALGKLREMEDSPWVQQCGSTNMLAKLLRPWGVKPKKHRTGKETTRGYSLAQLRHAFNQQQEAKPSWTGLEAVPGGVPSGTQPEHERVRNDNDLALPVPLFHLFRPLGPLRDRAVPDTPPVVTGTPEHSRNGGTLWPFGIRYRTGTDRNRSA